MCNKKYLYAVLQRGTSDVDTVFMHDRKIAEKDFELMYAVSTIMPTTERPWWVWMEELFGFECPVFTAEVEGGGKVSPEFMRILDDATDR